MQYSHHSLSAAYLTLRLAVLCLILWLLVMVLSEPAACVFNSFYCWNPVDYQPKDQPPMGARVYFESSLWMDCNCWAIGTVIGYAENLFPARLQTSYSTLVRGDSGCPIEFYTDGYRLTMVKNDNELS